MVQIQGDSLPNVRAAITPATDEQASVSNPTVTRIASAARRSQRHSLGTTAGIASEG